MKSTNQMNRFKQASSRWMTAGLFVLLMSGCTGAPKVVKKSEPPAALRLKAIDNHTQAEACRLTAIELAAHEKDEHAIAQFEQARKLDPDMEGIAHPLAVLYDRQGRLDAAQREYEHALKESSRDADIHNDYGYFLYSRGDQDAARTHLERALKLNNEHPKVRINLAMVEATQGKYDAAFQLFEEALGPAAAHHNIGLLKMRAGRQAEGLASLKQASVIDPSLDSEAILEAYYSPKAATGSEILPAGYVR